MGKLSTFLILSATALTINGVASAQNDPGTTSTQEHQQSPSPTRGRPDQREADTGMPEKRDATSQQSPENQANEGQPGARSQRDEEFAQATRKCETMTGSERKSCMEKARKAHDRM